MENPTIKVLLVEEDGQFVRLLRQSLAAFTHSRIELVVSERLDAALTRLSGEPVDAVLVDLNLPDSQGLDNFRRIQVQAPALPVIILAEFDNETLALQAVRRGAQDYLVKSRFEGRLLSRIIRYAIERKRTEEALRESEQRYRRLLGSTTDYIYTVGVDHGVSLPASHGPACAAVTGYTAEEYAADEHLWYRMIHPEDRPAVTDQVARLLVGETVRPLEHRILHKDGCVRWVRNTPVPRKDGRGRVISYDGLIADVTERKEAEQRVAAQCAVTCALAEAADLEEAASRVLRAVCDRLDWDAAALWIVRPQADALSCAAVWCKEGQPSPGLEAALRCATFAKGEELPGRVWEQGAPAWILDLTAEADRLPHFRVAIRERLHAAFSFPIAVNNQVLGVIGLFSRRTPSSDAGLLQMMKTVGGQIGQFILRKQTEDTLAEERNLLRTLIDTLPDAIYVKDTESRFVLANLGVARLMGAARVEDLYGRKDSEFYPAELAGRYYADERQVITSSQPLINREEPVIDATGTPGWLLTTKAPLRDLHGRTMGLVGIGRDITQRRKEEEAHRLTEARLQAILDNTTAVIYVKDREGRYSLVNRQFERLFGIPQDRVLRQTDFELFPAEVAEVLQANDREVLQARAPLEFEEVVPQPGEQRTYISIKFPLCDTAGAARAVCGISTDITERKRAETQLLQANAELVDANRHLSRSEEALRQALTELRASHEQLKATQLQLIQAEKLESIGTLAAGVAHEVKNPLQTILMGIAYLSRKPQARRGNAGIVLNEMRESIKRADSIVRGLVEFSSCNHPDVQDEALNQIIDQSLTLVKYELTKQHVTVVKDLAPSLPPLKLERNKIQQAFINLFLNAIQAMPEGGRLIVRTYEKRLNGDPGNHEPASPSASGKARTAVVAEVEDTGAGIPDDQLPRIFDPFFTTKAPGVGTGLGLPVTRKIVELHGGSIEVANHPGSGAQFSLTFKPEPDIAYE